MADPFQHTISNQSISSAYASGETEFISQRPRNRRPAGITNANRTKDGQAPDVPTTLENRGQSSSPVTSSDRGRKKNVQGLARNSGLTSTLGDEILETAWTKSWTSVQQIASSILGPTDNGDLRTQNPSGSRFNSWSPARSANKNPESRGLFTTWGPEPPRESLFGLATGTLVERDSASKAARKASVLQSHEGVNGGLDVAGNFKRRNSVGSLKEVDEQATEDRMAYYIHHVQPNDTYAGITLKYKCHEDSFRKANGLWSRDNVQFRKWLAIPVDSCEVKGRPCEVLLPCDWDLSKPDQTLVAGDQRTLATLSAAMTAIKVGKSDLSEQQHWTHVRWVHIDSVDSPVEIVRMSRKALGYFPPRRKKSIYMTSSISTPRQSFDTTHLAATPPNRTPNDTATIGSIDISQETTFEPHTPQRHGEYNMNTITEQPPMWMRRPGGVGSMSRHTTAPGPANDALNSWAGKHLPGLELGSLPSMAVLGSESANFGMRMGPVELAETPLAPLDGDSNVTPNDKQVSSLDKAAATIETWLRGAFATRTAPPVLSSRTNLQPSGDLIELTDTGSDDGRIVDSLTTRREQKNGGWLDSAGPSSQEYENAFQGDGVRYQGKKTS